MEHGDIGKLHCPRWKELPPISLYMDQVLEVLAEPLSPFETEEERSATSTMINNYVKLKLIEPPEKRKYTRTHITRLYMICILKHVFAMSDVAGLLKLLTDGVTDEDAYDFFCDEFEGALRALADGAPEAREPLPKECPKGRRLLRAALTAYACKLSVENAVADGNSVADYGGSGKSSKK